MRTLKPTLTLLLALLMALAAAPAALAQDADTESNAGQLSTRELVETQLADLKERLDLSDYQWTQVQMILKSSIRERVAITRRYGLDGDPASLEALEGKDKRAMRKELKACRKDTEKRMKRYLDKDQYKAFKAVQEEIHEDLIARLEEA